MNATTLSVSMPVFHMQYLMANISLNADITIAL